MKTYKKIGFNSSKLNHEEMKNIKAGSDFSSYWCFLDYNTCSSGSGVCFLDDTPFGGMGLCSFEVFDQLGSVYFADCKCL